MTASALPLAATSPAAARLAALRAHLATIGLSGFYVPLTDEHMSEYVGDYAQRLAWLTGFTGSAGSAVVLADKAAVFTDGRYTVQTRAEVSPALFSYEPFPDVTPASWLGGNAQSGDRIGYDPWLATRSWAKSAAEQLAARGASLVALEANPIDVVWADQPAPSLAPARVHPDALAGKSSADKRRDLATDLREAGADVAVIAALDSVAWLFNIRGTDVSHTPVVRAFALLQADATADLFLEPEKLNDAVLEHLGPAVRTHARTDFAAALAALGGKRVLVDPETCVAAIFEALDAAGATLIEKRDPCILPKARKNGVEAEGARAAHLRDGAAITRLLHWLSLHAGDGTVDEAAVEAQILSFRRETNQLLDTSFNTIAGAGPNAALPHYRSGPATNRVLAPGELFLVDSGGQYADGTTDITRTIAVGTPTSEQRDRYTRVLKGHIALATARFPVGTNGQQLDVLARLPLWQAGLDYDHGTGHGVGAYLSVHEGPQRIAKAASSVPLEPGMILSNEPGYYKPGHFGIRIENLVLVAEQSRQGDERPMLAFETLTLAPLDRALIDTALLSAEERAWVDAYHARVWREIGPLVQDETRQWLEQATQPL